MRRAARFDVSTLLFAAIAVAALPATARSDDLVPPLVCPPRDAAGAERDIVSLRDGTKRLGTAIEWGSQVLILTGGGKVESLAGVDVESIVRRPAGQPTTQPTGADLTVAWDEPPATATGPLAVHVQNAGGADAAPFEVSVQVGGRERYRGRAPSRLPAGKSCVVLATPVGEPPAFDAAAPTRVRVELDPRNELKESARRNNSFEDWIPGWPVAVVIGRKRYDALRTGANPLDSAAAEDWIQFQVQSFNRLLSEPPGGAPAGRFRVARIVVVDRLPSGEVDAARAAAGLSADSGELLFAIPDGAATSHPAESASWRVDWGQLASLMRQMGLPDLSSLATAHDRILTRDGDNLLVQVDYLPAPESFLVAPGPRPPGDVERAYLAAAQMRGPGAVTSQPRVTAPWLREPFELLPKQCTLRVQDERGQALPGVDVALFQRTGTAAGRDFIPEEPVLVGETDAAGRLAMPNREATHPRANPFGDLLPDGTNSVCLVRLRKNGATEFHFVSAVEFLQAAARGQAASGEVLLGTRLSAISTPRPRYELMRYNYDNPDDPSAYYQFPILRNPTALEYRLFARPARSAAWSLVEVAAATAANSRDVLVMKTRAAPIAERTPGPIGTEFALSVVDAAGRAGPLGPVQLAPRPRADRVRLAIEPGASNVHAIVLQAGPLETSLLRSDEVSTFSDYGVRTLDFPNYSPWGAGAVFDSRGRMIVADPHNHQVAWYDAGILTRLVGKSPPGPSAAGADKEQFNAPQDVAVDARNRVFVADTGNDRVVMLDEAGKFVDVLHGSGAEAARPFSRPMALGCSFDRLCVTDLDGRRVQVFDVSGDVPKRVRLVQQELVAADRALVGHSGRIYVTATPAGSLGAVMIYPPDADLTGRQAKERSVEYTVRGQIRDGQGFAFDGRGSGLFVTSHPYRIQKFGLE
ncbi:MAG: hypothetical protein U1A27_13055 [Phycisphaerae bacterium]